MSLVCERAHWNVYSLVEKYSPDQVAFAQERLASARSWLGGQPVSRRQSAAYPEGDWLRRHCGDPEDGCREDYGNLLVTAGLTNLTSLWLGQTGTAVNPLKLNSGSTAGAATCGVGATATAASVADTVLGANNTANAYYQIADTSYPTSSAGVVTLQSTFGTSVANFAWNEWCWATGAGAITAGTALASIYATASSFAMVNHKVPASSLGTKASGASWVFTTTVTIS